MLQVIQQQQLDRRFISLTTSTPSTPTINTNQLTKSLIRQPLGLTHQLAVLQLLVLVVRCC
jgi:hypothetical protein